MKVLVTGGAGFIGSAVCRHLVAEGDAVVNVDVMAYAATRGSTAALEGHAGYSFEQADITDAAAMTRVFAAHDPDAVLHLAAESHVDFHGVLWICDQFAGGAHVSLAQLRAGLTAIAAHPRCRLPTAEVEQRLNRYGA